MKIFVLMFLFLIHYQFIYADDLSSIGCTGETMDIFNIESKYSPNPIDILADAKDNIFYFADGSSDSNIFIRRSRDGGVNWSTVFSRKSQGGNWGSALAKNSKDHIFALGHDLYGFAVWKSVDEGETWSEVFRNNLFSAVDMVINKDDEIFIAYWANVPDVYPKPERILQSNNGGLTWFDSGLPAPKYATYTRLETDPFRGTVYVNHDYCYNGCGPAFKKVISVLKPKGQWSNLPDILEPFPYESMIFSNKKESFLRVGVVKHGRGYDNYEFIARKSMDQGLTWKKIYSKDRLTASLVDSFLASNGFIYSFGAAAESASLAIRKSSVDFNYSREVRDPAIRSIGGITEDSKAYLWVTGFKINKKNRRVVIARRYMCK